jgi:uncharacterized protein
MITALKRPAAAFNTHKQAIKAMVLENHAANPRVFGSVVLGTDTALSDLDLLVDTTDETTLFDIARLKMQLKQLIGFEVDVLTPKAIHHSMRDRVYAHCIAL